MSGRMLQQIFPSGNSKSRAMISLISQTKTTRIVLKLHPFHSVAHPLPLDFLEVLRPHHPSLADHQEHPLRPRCLEVLRPLHLELRLFLVGDHLRHHLHLVIDL